LAVWLYRFRDLESEAVLADLQRRQVNRVFLSVPRTLLTESGGKLARFLSGAHRKGMEVHAMLLEDPSFVLRENHPRAKRDVETLIAYCREHPAAAFDGVHLDAEPHVLFQGKGKRTDADWAANEALMQQYGELLAQTFRQVRESGLKGISNRPLSLSAAVAWWHNERAKDGHLPSGAVKTLTRYLDFVVPMVYDGIGGSAADVARRVDDELAEAPTLVGVARKEYPSDDALRTAISALNERYAASPNFRGVSVFEYARWAGVPRKE
jgi:hypothetical protein